MNICLAAMGKLKDEWQREACVEYLKRLSAFARVTVKEPEPVKLSQKPADGEIARALSEEARLIRSALGSVDFTVALCIEGRELSSEELSDRLERLSASGVSTVGFVIGSSYGLDEELKRSADLRLSMSPMTFPHGLARVMLLEQLYRAFMISSHRNYHKVSRL